MFTQLHIMPDSIYSRPELYGVYFTFKFHHMFCDNDFRQCLSEADYG